MLLIFVVPFKYDVEIWLYCRLERLCCLLCGRMSSDKNSPPPPSQLGALLLSSYKLRNIIKGLCRYIIPILCKGGYKFKIDFL